MPSPLFIKSLMCSYSSAKHFQEGDVLEHLGNNMFLQVQIWGGASDELVQFSELHPLADQVFTVTLVLAHVYLVFSYQTRCM